MTALLDVRDLSKRFAARPGRPPPPWILKDLSFSVNEGEFLTIVGPSGSGKTTLLNIIAQIDVASGGAVIFEGKETPVNDPRRLRPGAGRRIGYVTQDDNLLPWRTALDNVLFPFEIGRRLTPDIRAKAHDMMDAVGLTGHERHYPHELSGGMRKRCSLIRTLIYNPPIILMDEPFGAVDAQTRMQLQEDLLRLWALGRKTIVFVTHDIGEAIALGDRALVLTRAPTRVAGEHIIDIPRPRDVKDMFLLPGFAPLYERVRAQVR